MRVLGLVFTVGVSLEQWNRQGLLSREKQIYEEYLEKRKFDKIIWFTYGKNDRELRNKLVREGKLHAQIEVVSIPKFFIGKYKNQMYSYLLPYLHRQECEQLDVIKSNQMGGAWTAEKIHQMYGIPFILRTGYTYTSNFLQTLQSEKNIKQKIKIRYLLFKYRHIENKMYHRCNVATVSSFHDKRYICETYGIDEEKVINVGNYIDCAQFRSVDINEKEDRFIFVGRISKEKNLFNIIKGLSKAGVGIDIYGEGDLEEEVARFIKKNDFDAKLMGVVENNKLPYVLNQYKYYILASEHEGMPKALLEAMACGLVCIGTDVDGINEVIENEKNGFLARSVDYLDIYKVVEKMKACCYIEEIRNNAQKYIKTHFSVEKVVESEWNILSNYIK